MTYFDNIGNPCEPELPCARCQAYERELVRNELELRRLRELARDLQNIIMNRITEDAAH